MWLYRFSLYAEMEMEIIAVEYTVLEFLANIKTQHSELALKLKKLKSLSLQGKETKQYLFQLNVLIGYLSAHFATEEQIMQSCDYSLFIKHKQQHLDFINTTTRFSYEIALRENTNLSDVTQFIELWFEEHDIDFDIALETFLAKKAV